MSLLTPVVPLPLGVPGPAKTGFIQTHSRHSGRMILFHVSIVGVIEDRGDGLTVLKSRHKGSRGWQLSTPLGDILKQLEDAALAGAAGGGPLP